MDITRYIKEHEEEFKEYFRIYDKIEELRLDAVNQKLVVQLYTGDVLFGNIWVIESWIKSKRLQDFTRGENIWI